MRVRIAEDSNLRDSRYSTALSSTKGETVKQVNTKTSECDVCEGEGLGSEPFYKTVWLCTYICVCVLMLDTSAISSRRDKRKLEI